MNRRGCLTFLASLPLVGWLVPKASGKQTGLHKLMPGSGVQMRTAAEADFYRDAFPLATRARKIILKHQPEALICSPDTWNALRKEVDGIARCVGEDPHIDGVPVHIVDGTQAPFGEFLAAWDVKKVGFDLWSFRAKVQGLPA